MAEFFEFLSSNELTIVVCLMIVIFILIMSIIIIDIVNKNKINKRNVGSDEYFEDLDRTNIKINNDGIGMVADESALDKIDVEAVTKNLERTQEIEEIKYVEEDDELEKTKALLELETLKKELAKMEEEKEASVVEEVKPEIVNDAVVEVKPLDVVENTMENEKETPVIEEQPEVDKEKPLTMEEEVNNFESEQEEKAIISVEELMKASETITDEEIEEYEDDGNEPISIKELEALYKSVEEPLEIIQEEKTKLPEFDIKVKPANEVYDGKSFKNSSVISPVFGIKTNEESIMLEQTANLDKLNEEIRKTNEFLSMLKELRKNLE